MSALLQSITTDLELGVRSLAAVDVVPDAEVHILIPDLPRRFLQTRADR
jgi:hypothetical protein